jgi:hypothetical protein
MTDWFMVVFIAIVGVGAIAVNPGIGMVIVPIVVGLMHYLGVFTLPEYSLVALIAVGMLGAFLMWRDD